MTNAIETAKREMYEAFKNLKGRIEINYSIKDMLRGADEFENWLEDYLEALRQEHESLHETARARFENASKLWEANVELIQRLAKMTEERDSIQLRLHAVDHAYKEQQSRTATLTQDSGDRVASATPDAKTMALLGAVADVQRLVSDWGMQDIKAKKAMLKIARVVNGEPCYSAMLEFEKPDACMHSFHRLPLSRDDKGEICTFCGVEK